MVLERFSPVASHRLFILEPLTSSFGFPVGGSVVKATKGDRVLWPGPLINSLAMAPFERDPRFAVDSTNGHTHFCEFAFQGTHVW